MTPSSVDLVKVGAIVLPYKINLNYQTQITEFNVCNNLMKHIIDLNWERDILLGMFN